MTTNNKFDDSGYLKDDENITLTLYTSDIEEIVSKFDELYKLTVENIEWLQIYKEGRYEIWAKRVGNNKNSFNFVIVFEQEYTYDWITQKCQSISAKISNNVIRFIIKKDDMSYYNSGNEKYKTYTFLYRKDFERNNTSSLSYRSFGKSINIGKL